MSRSTKTVAIGNGQSTVLQPGNVYFNEANLTNVGANTSDKTISIVQKKVGAVSQYDFSGLSPSVVTEIGSLDQDMYVVGDVINETGAVTIKNFEGSITVSGTISGNPIDIFSAKDFTLNSDDWFHTGKDPRQLINYDARRALVFNTDGNYQQQAYSDPTNVDGINLQTAINAPGAKIVAQGTIAITARFLDINGLIQSGAQNVDLNVDNTFIPPADGQLINANGDTVQGVNFGTEAIPVKAFFDPSQQAIVVDNLNPEGGQVIQAGQILSPGGGAIKVGYGYANVDITNTSNYKLIVNGVDTTKNRVGKITIIDTPRIGTSATDAKTVYTLDASGVTRMTYSGVLSSGVSSSDGAVATIDYALTNTDHPSTTGLTWAPRAGLHYVWTEGQSLTQTELRHYDKESFNLFGGGTGFEDWLASDNSYKWKTNEFTDPRPLLESEALAIEGGSGGDANPSFTNGDAYGISYVRQGDPTVAVTQNITTVWDVSQGGGASGGWRYIGVTARVQLTASGVLPARGASNDSWEWHNEITEPPDTFTHLPAATSTSADYRSDFENQSHQVKQWTEGGGWLQTKHDITEVTTITGKKDYYTHSLKADYAVSISAAGNTSSHINISSSKDLLVGGNITVASGGDVSLTSTSGSVLGNGTAAIFNDDLNITAAGNATGILVEGGPDPVNVHAGGNIGITAIQGGVDRSLKVDQIISAGGYVKLVAPDGISVVNPGTSLIQGEIIEPDAISGSIGGSGTIRIDSNILNDGNGGLSALAEGSINLREINGDLFLIQAQGSILPAVQAGGNVTLEAHTGSLPDALH